MQTATNAIPNLSATELSLFWTMTAEPIIPRRSKRIRSRTQNAEVKTAQKAMSKGITKRCKRRKKAPETSNAEVDSSPTCENWDSFYKTDQQPARKGSRQGAKARTEEGTETVRTVKGLSVTDSERASEQGEKTQIIAGSSEDAHKAPITQDTLRSVQAGGSRDDELLKLNAEEQVRGFLGEASLELKRDIQERDSFSSAEEVTPRAGFRAVPRKQKITPRRDMPALCPR